MYSENDINWTCLIKSILYNNTKLVHVMAFSYMRRNLMILYTIYCFACVYLRKICLPFSSIWEEGCYEIEIGRAINISVKERGWICGDWT